MWVRGSCTVPECIVGIVAYGRDPRDLAQTGSDDPALLAAGITPGHMLAGYRAGAFPMDAEGATGPVEWFVCDPRAVILPADARTPRTVARMLRRRGYEVRVDTAFGKVVRECARDRDGVWLTERLAHGYDALHAVGLAHSVEAWDGDVLVGGLFGVTIGQFMSAESMFHRAPDAGSAVIVALIEIANASGGELIDVQMSSPHVIRFGAREIPAAEFERRMAHALGELPRPSVSDT
ncbi:MAG: leucyl/phenylalanyl-tRNA--protein transferase [Thermoleophilia bacterium]|nr:leucyl/phenylalanyl-tRNA--protein transferase [Thermoleophilia bacterium]